MDEKDLLERYNKIYLSVIMRYKDSIEENENLYIAELPKLILPQDASVVAVARNITSVFPAYEYENDFRNALKMAYEYVSKEVAAVSLPIQFWQRPNETISNGAGDLFDKAVLLCSIMISLGAIPSKIIIAVKEDGERNFLVYTEYKGKILFVDIEQGVGELESKEGLLKKLNIGKDSEISAYEFNDKMYVDLA